MQKSIFKQDPSFVPLLVKKEDIFELIDITEPYFAFDAIYVDEKNSVSAEVAVEQPVGSEIMPVSSAEASRHMEILGVVSCAFANPNKEKHYYLAHAGSYKRISIQNSAGNTKKLRVNAACKYIDKRKAIAATQIVDSKNQIICEAEVFYHIIPQLLFERLYQPFHNKFPNHDIDNPYKLKNELFDIKLTTTNLKATLGRLPENYCSGHFPKFPAMPVAILLYNLIDLAGLFIYHSTRDYRLKFIVKDFTLTAESIAFAREKVDLEIKHMHSFDNLFVLSCIATVGSRNVCEVKVSIEGVK